MPATISDIKVPAKSEGRISSIMALTFAPWVLVVLFSSSFSGTLNLLAYAGVTFAVGYAVIGFSVCRNAPGAAWMLAPSTGVLVVSGVSALWVRCGLPLLWSMLIWLAIAIAGLIAFWKQRAEWKTRTIAYGRTLAVFSALISVVYFLPSALNDMVQRHDGSYEWMFIDTQHFHGIAASIKGGGSPPTTPGTATAELLYHFGPYAPAAAISRLDGLDLGDAVARVTRAVSIWALVLSCFGLGTLLSIRATASEFGGIMSVAGLFFYGSLGSLFTEETNTFGHLARALLFRIPRLDVLGDGGPFNHFLDGHSLLHGLVAVTAIMGLCLRWADREIPCFGEFALLILPALAIAVNSEASLYCLAFSIVLLFWRHPQSLRSWASIAVMLVLFYAGWSVMGYSHSTDAGLLRFNKGLAGEWWQMAVWFIIGLGLRLIAFRWISRPFSDPLSAVVLVSVVGWLAFALLIDLRDDNEHYGIYFLQSVLSIFAFSRFAPGWWRGAERSRLIRDWLRTATKLMIVLLMCGVAARIAIYLMHSQTWVASLRLQVLPFIVVLLLVIGALALMNRGSRFSPAISGCVLGVQLIGFLAWLPTWTRFGLQTTPTSVVYSSGETSGLRRLRELMAPEDRFATNKHNIDRMSPLPPLALSYGYSALAEHPVLLEGYLARGEDALPWFKNLHHDNDLLFATTDAETLHRIAKTWNVRWLVARPGTDIAIPRPLPTWLIAEQNSGDLKIYRVD